MLLRRALDYLLFGLLIFVPFISLVQFDETVYPYVVSKHYVFRFVVMFMGGIWLALALDDSRFRPQKSPVLYGLLGFIGVAFVANIFGANFWNSFWSNYSRMEGFLSLLIFLLFFLLLNSVLNSVQRWNQYWLSHVFVSIIIFGVAVLQKMQLMLAVDYNRVDGIFGNASYLAIYASMIFFLCLYLFFSFRSKWLRGFIILAALCNLASIYLSQTRSATLGVLLCLGFFGYSLSKNKGKALISIFGVLAAFVVGVFLLKSRSGVSTNLFERIAQISLKDSSTQARVEIWAYCWRAFLDQPLLGWGQENFSYLATFYRPQLWSTPWVDRSHNIFLEWMVNAGAVGLVALCALLGLIFVGLLKAKENDLSKPQKMALLSLFFCWLINQCLSIDFFSISILFYSLAALSHNFYCKGWTSNFVQPNSEKKIISFKGSQWVKMSVLVLIFVGFGLVLNFQLNINGLLRNIEMRQFSKADSILQADKNKECQATIDRQIKGKNLSFEARELRSYLIQNSHFALNQFRLKNLSESCVSLYYEVTHQVIQKEIVTDANDLFFKHVSANFYTQFFNFPAAHKLFQELIGKIPQQQNFWIDYGHWHLAQGRLDEGLRMYQKAYDLEHENPIAMMYLAMGFIYLKRFAEGNKFTNLLIEWGRPEAFDERLINAYLAMGQKQKVDELVAFKNKFYGPDAN